MQLWAAFGALWVFAAAAANAGQSPPIGVCASQVTKSAKIACIRKQHEQTQAGYYPSGGPDWILADRWFIWPSPVDQNGFTHVTVYTDRRLILSGDAPSQRFSLMFRCNLGQTSVSFGIDGQQPEERDGVAKAVVRIDEQSPIEKRFAVDGHLLVMESNDEASDLAEKMLGANKLVVQFDAKQIGTLKVELDITLVEIALQPLRAECEW